MKISINKFFSKSCKVLRTDTGLYSISSLLFLLIILEAVIQVSWPPAYTLLLPAILGSFLTFYRPEFTMIVFVSLSIGLAIFYEFLSIIPVFLLYIVVYYILRNFLIFGKSLLVISILAHIGDAVSTYYGVNQSLSEANPIVNFLFSVTSTEVIFPIKFLVFPITIYAYITLDKLKAETFLLLVYLIGLYLTLSNTLTVLVG